LYDKSTNPTDVSSDQSNINYSPPTDEEQNSGNELKQEIVDNNQVDSSGSADTDVKKQTTVIITDANQYEDVIEVRAFMPDAFEDGTCTVLFSNEGVSKTIQKEAPAYIDASTTICTNPEIQRSEFSVSGVWKVTVTYVSDHYNGTSEIKEITID
jgi:hypothetical protein